MNGSGRAGSGRGNNRKRPFRRREKDNDFWQERESPESGNGTSQKGSGVTGKPNNRGQQPSFSRPPTSSPQKKHGDNRGDNRSDNRGEKAPFVERPRWIPPVMNNEPLPNHNCLWCGKPIRDLTSAIADKDTGVPLHFECVAARIATGEILEKGDSVIYIGGGRFGVVGFTGADNRNFKIKKVIEWENNDKKSEWRTKICDHYSII